MRKLKPILSIFLVFALMFSFSSCMIFEYFPTNFSNVNLNYDDSNNRYFYNTLSENAKVAYTIILNDMKKHYEDIEVPNITTEEFNEVFHALSYDNPDYLCLGTTSELKVVRKKYYFVPKYSHTSNECEKLHNELEDSVNKIIFAMPEGLSDFDKELYIHDAVCNACEYDHSSDGINKNKAYDALVEGLAVCEGYARATQLLLNRVNIPNYLIVGSGINSKGKNESHMWNIVTLDGNNYHLDTTWDDLGKDNTPSISYTYFNVTDKAISANHFNFVPAINNCVSLNQNYYFIKGLYYDNISQINYDKLVEKITSSKSQDNFEIAFSDKTVYDKAKNKFIDNGDIYDVLNIVNKKLRSKKFQNVMYILDDDMLVIHFIFE